MIKNREIKIYENSLFKILTIIINEEPWFLVKDICISLGLSDTNKVCYKLDEKEKCVVNIYYSNQYRNMTFVNKIGLYKILLSSNKTKAKELIDPILNSVSGLDNILKALNSFEVPEDLPDMYVYAIRNNTTGNIKLGISKNPENRLKQLQTGNDCELELIATSKAVNKFSDEVFLHKKYKDFNIRGEWFNGCVKNALN